jgi:acyl-CoA oxidase
VALTFLMLCPRTVGLASELLLSRYALEPPRFPDNLLAQHEKGLFSELRAALATAPSHRSETYDREVLPRSLPLIRAIGHRISYDAARAAEVDGPLLDLFEASSVLQDEAWYVERLGVTRAELREREARALEAVFPRLEEYLERMDVAAYVVAPIVSDEKWKEFVSTLEVFGETSSGWNPELSGPFLGSSVSATPQQIAPHRSVRSRL